jgi:fumarate hydratase class II
LELPATQPGSSIMPGKVNPVMCEMVIQTGAQVVGNDAVITFGAVFGNFELNTMLPVIAHNLLQSINLLANASRVFARHCVAGLRVHAARIAANLDHHAGGCAALAPLIGYDLAARIARRAHETGRSVRDVALEMSGLAPVQLAALLNPASMMGPGLPPNPVPGDPPGLADSPTLPTPQVSRPTADDTSPLSAPL